MAILFYCEVEDGLRFDHRNLIRVRSEGMYVQFVSSGFEVYITERLKAAYLQLWKLDKYAAVACEAFEIKMALTVQVRAHLFDLKIRHVTYGPAQCAFVGSRSAKLESFDQPLLRQHLPR